MENTDKKNKKRFSRRNFLAITGSGLAGALALLYFGRGPIRRKISDFTSEMEIAADVSDLDPKLWFELNADNTITLKSPKVEMGQGIFTGFAMLAAEELDFQLDKIKVVHANSKNGVLSNTGVSNSTSSFYVIIREVAATLRETLKLQASKIWNVPITNISTKDGMLIAGDKKISYADLAKQIPKWEIAEKPALRPTSTFKYVGKEQIRIDLPDKILGKPIYGIDTTLPDMVYGAVLYSPYINGKLKSVDTNNAKNTEGVLKIIEEKEWVGIVATTRFAAESAIKNIKADWNYAPNINTKAIEKLMTVGNGNEVNIQNDGDTNKVPSKAITGEFRTPIGFHACLEPSIVVADFKENKVTIYTSFQNPTYIQTSVSEALDIDKENIDIIPAYLGGGFGRKAFKSNAVEAAKLSKAVGKPVHLLYTRQQEFQNGYVRPNTHHVLKGKLGNDGNILAFEHDIATGPMAFKAVPAIAETILGADFIVAGHGSRCAYRIPNIKTTIWHNNLPFETSMWRGVGMFANTFAIESFMDILAHQAGINPLKFRLNHCENNEKLKRRKKILELIGQKSGWSNAKPIDVGRGMAICEDHKTISAAVVEIKIEDGLIKVKNVVQFIDPGKIINPDGIRQQVEGATMMAISASLYEKGTIEDSQFVETNFHLYKVVTLKDTPKIEVILHEGSDKPSGVGEPPISPIAPAIANAIFDLTGIRLYSLPLQQAFENAKTT
ncbi:molybdopterin cofactor-binding domain-containing protein [Emticicia sp. SJ17W-69]|uniref:xanthine dehydrogenase family protein molybdopterin-binding subunit n=1 Tax=Emticicia sp. SJ17W-69 TaxID=3421657 RepID=UPI003EB6D07C